MKLKMNPAIELISIGTELLSGRTLNSHARTLGAALTKVGLRLSRDTTIPDGMEVIQAAVREAFSRVDIAVISGGLGPTTDDMTRDALAALFECDIVPSPEGLVALRERYGRRGLSVKPAAERQALILDGAVTLINSAGMAPGQRLDLPEGKVLFIVPGPPAEFSAVLNEQIVPWLQAVFHDVVPLEERVMTVQGIGESDMVTRLEKIGFEPVGVSIGFYPGGGRVEIRLSAPKENVQALDEAERILVEQLRDRIL